MQLADDTIRSGRKPPAEPATPSDVFYRYRQAQARRACVLGMVVIEVAGDHGIGLRRAPDLRVACLEAWAPPDGRMIR